MSAAAEQFEYVSVERAIPMRRVWAMPSANTFDILPIRALVKKYLQTSIVSVDPFARNKRWATYTNDLNPETAAEHHMDALDFLLTLREKGVTVDLVLFDPPYSPNQVYEQYQSIDQDIRGNHYTFLARKMKEWKDVVAVLTRSMGVVVCFGWNSNGMGVSRGYRLEEVLVVAHGGAHNDTIVTVERKVESAQMGLFSTQQNVLRDNDPRKPEFLASSTE